MIRSVDPVEDYGPIRDPSVSYCEDVLRGRIPACRKIKQACRRHLLDLKRSHEDDEYPFYYDPEAAARVVRFARKLRHWEGEWSGQLFQPGLWQIFILSSIFGWKRRSDDKRRFRYAYIEIPRKNGKSFLASVVALYMLFADGEDGSQVYAAATKRDQAKIVWGAAIKIAKKSGLLGKHLSEHWLSLQHKASDSTFQPLASDSEKLDGLNPHCAICDELHEWADRRLWDVIEDAFGARSQPLMFVITTAGYNRYGICYQQRTHTVNILENVDTGSYSDDTYFGFIADVDDEFLTDPEDQTLPKHWTKEEVWRMANPCLGVAKKLDYMRDQCNKAMLQASKENAFKNKQLNIWTEAAERWLNMDAWDSCNGPVDRVKLKRAKCYAALDLSSIQDLTANVLLFPPAVYPEWTILPFFYLPEENLRERETRDRVPYRQWVNEGLITLTPGNTIDLEFIREDVLRLKREFNIIECGFDPWKAVEISTKLETEGLNMVQMRQGHATLGPPTVDLELKVLRREVRHGGHPVLRWMAANATVIRDSNDNIRPDKGGGEDGKGRAKPTNRIDGIVATVMALGLAIKDGRATGKSIYESRGVLSVGPT